MSKVLVVDDEERIRNLMARSLGVEGHHVVTTGDGLLALERLAEESFDLVVLDLMMPRCNGLAVLSMMNERADATPVIVLSGVTEVATRVQALERGAVDVVAKPFSLVELLARTRRHLAPPKPRSGEQRYLDSGGIRLDLHRRCARVGAKDVVLSEREFSLLAHLMRRRGEVCTREELLREVWGLTFDPGSNVVEVGVRRLRAKLEPDPPIETIRHVGYCFSGE